MTGGCSQKLKDPILNYKHEIEKTSWAWSKAVNSEPAPSDTPQTAHPQASITPQYPSLWSTLLILKQHILLCLCRLMAVSEC